MLTRILMSFIAIMFPWLVLLLADNPGGAIVAIIMQASIIGWPFATVWAWRTVKESRKAQLAEKKAKKENAQSLSQSRKAQAQTKTEE